MSIKVSDTQFIEDMLSLPIFKGLPAPLFVRAIEHHKHQWETQPHQYIVEPLDHAEIEQVQALWAKYFPDRQWPK